ncbi:MAG: hypothetical protein RLY69_105, partial [Verrucomicrobiota bacterium]
MPKLPEFEPVQTSAGWMVSVPPKMSADGKRHRKFFSVKRDADRYAGKLRASWASGLRGGMIPASVAMEAQRALAVLEGTGIGLLEAAKIVAKQMASSGAQETFLQRYDRAVLDGEGRWSKRYRQDMVRMLRWLPKKFLSLPCGTIDRAVVEAALVQDRPLARSTIDARTTRPLHSGPCCIYLL